jgi:hypothetical protein
MSPRAVYLASPFWGRRPSSWRERLPCSPRRRTCSAAFAPHWPRLGEVRIESGSALPSALPWRLRATGVPQEADPIADKAGDLFYRVECRCETARSGLMLCRPAEPTVGQGQVNSFHLLRSRSQPIVGASMHPLRFLWERIERARRAAKSEPDLLRLAMIASRPRRHVSHDGPGLATTHRPTARRDRLDSYQIERAVGLHHTAASWTVRLAGVSFARRAPCRSAYRPQKAGILYDGYPSGRPPAYRSCSRWSTCCATAAAARTASVCRAPRKNSDLREFVRV